MPLPDAPVVEIDVGEVTPTSEDAVFTTGSSTSATWTDYYIQCRMEKDYHRYMLGVTSPNGVIAAGNPTVAFVQLTSPTVVWIADWTASRSQSKPTIPSSRQVLAGSEAQWVILDETLEPGMITSEPNGKAGMYRISGTYVYGALNPHVYLNRDCVFPLPPWLNKSAFDRTIPDSMFEKGLINEPAPQ